MNYVFKGYSSISVQRYTKFARYARKNAQMSVFSGYGLRVTGYGSTKKSPLHSLYIPAPLTLPYPSMYQFYPVFSKF